MLHILLLILKIIGLIIAAILGILVLLVCIVLFVPIRYEIAGKCDGSIDSLRAKVKVTWLLHLIRADYMFKNKKQMWRFRALWIKKGGKTNEQNEEINRPEQEVSQSSKEPVIKDEVTKDESVQAKPQVDERAEEVGQSSEVLEERLEEPAQKIESTKEVLQENQRTWQTERETTESVEEERQSIWEKLKEIAEKIKCTITGICDKIKSLLNKKDKVMEFLSNEVHKGAFLKAKKELFKLLKKLKPKKIKADITYGFDDPCTTGQVLAAFAVAYPFIGECTNVTPDFENKVFKGMLYVKGTIRVSYFVSLALRMLLNKNVRKTYKDVREFQL